MLWGSSTLARLADPPRERRGGRVSWGAVAKRILFVFPTAWDRRQLDACAGSWRGRFEPLFAEPTAERGHPVA